MKSVKQLKKELCAAAFTVLIAAFSLSTTTYAWYVSNNTVSVETSTISAMTNGFILQIASKSEGAQHGGNQKSLTASAVGGQISPSSTNDLKNWYVCSGFNESGMVNSYSKQGFDSDADAKPGQYTVSGKEYYAYCMSEFIIYTINQTGKADVYLDCSDGAPITIAVDNGKAPSSDTVEKSLRVAITMQDLDANGDPLGEEELRLVYALSEVTGVGNDAKGQADKWTCIGIEEGSDELKPIEVTYPHVYTGNYVDQNGKNRAATKDDKGYTVANNSEALYSNVDFDGVLMRVYIWMEGTDADCVNNAATEDETTYTVTVKVAGVSA